MTEVAVVPGTDGQKMSKSYNNTIPLFADRETITKAVMSIKTDSKGVEEPKNPDEDNIFALHKLFISGPELEELRSRYTNGGIGYKESKEILIENIDKFIAPLREKREMIAQDKDMVIDVLKVGGEKARHIADKKLAEAKEKVGVAFY